MVLVRTGGCVIQPLELQECRKCSLDSCNSCLPSRIVCIVDHHLPKLMRVCSTDVADHPTSLTDVQLIDDRATGGTCLIDVHPRRDDCGVIISTWPSINHRDEMCAHCLIRRVVTRWYHRLSSSWKSCAGSKRNRPCPSVRPPPIPTNRPAVWRSVITCA